MKTASQASIQTAQQPLVKTVPQPPKPATQPVQPPKTATQVLGKTYPQDQVRCEASKIAEQENNSSSTLQAQGGVKNIYFF